MSRKPVSTAHRFLKYANGIGALAFPPHGTPYVFDSSKFNTGGALIELSFAYAKVIAEQLGKNMFRFDALHSPQGKKAHLASAVAQAMSYIGIGSYPFSSTYIDDCGDIKQSGAVLDGKDVLLVSSVATDAEDEKDAAHEIEIGNGRLSGLIVAFDPQEEHARGRTIVQEFARENKIPVIAIATAADLLTLLEQTPPESGDDQVGELFNRMNSFYRSACVAA